jgi:hypothetical protein
MGENVEIAEPVHGCTDPPPIFSPTEKIMRVGRTASRFELV